ncbi:GH1 family beta-glucosidase [Cellulomonas sp. C5510]|uniref:GH1 family beta-glucosidase n=1 Tax=Cellulomonas sp. C5510 TaxID=2871170 RepID=UPI0021063F20|nr:GH1 family beta-glucosidase [Cellulomonas sp. C5510]
MTGAAAAGAGAATALPPSPWPAPDPLGPRRFPDGFAWGVATAAYQIEGAAHSDGRTDSIWDAFARVPGAVENGDDGEVACDHYHRSAEDVRLMQDLGVRTYRFSTSWARVRPDGGPVNPQGVAFYDRLVDQLLAAGIEPWPTLYHWDLPQALQERGGWAARSTAELFAEYALDLHAALGDRVRTWTTLNEPWCSAFLGYAGGQHAPGLQDDVAALRAVHHLNLAHGLATRALRDADPGARLGLTLNFSRYQPLDPSDPADVDTARRVADAQHGVFTGPVFRGAYPEGFLSDVEGLWPDDLVHDGDLATISAPVDVLGVNYYNSWVVGAPDGSGAVSPSGASARTVVSPWLTARGARWVRTRADRTAMDWENHPGAFRDLLVALHRDVTGPAGAHLVITENGAAYDDTDVVDGVVQDPDRIAYLRSHLAAVHQAVEQGADVRGYLLWTLLDNYEWAYGYSKKFGIVHVDRSTLARTPKASAGWYAEVMRSGVLR